MARKLRKIVIAYFLVIFVFGGTVADASVFTNKVSETEKVVAPQVIHKQQKFKTDSINEFVNVLDINLSNTYTKLEIGMSDPLKLRNTTSNLAKAHSYEGHQVVGAVNASYFLANGLPANLLAQNNEIINYGILGENTESPTQNPVAFGVSKDGTAIADEFKTNLTFKVNGQEYKIDNINSERAQNKNVLYTPVSGTTGTNIYGAEIVVTSATQNTNELHFGDQISGVVSHVTGYGETGNSQIPADGLVISIQNKELAQSLKNSVAIGSTIDVSLSIDEKWMDAEFILAAGPLLVKNGQVNISMPTTTTFAKSRQPRTAVAVDATGKKVFFVTVDGRSTGHSNGTSLTDLANHLISLGATSAINLDGGGSTTMVVRNPGDIYPTIVNKPSDGYERKVSTILQVVNTAPKGTVKSFNINGIPSQMMVGTSANLNIIKVYDEYFNPLTIHPSDVIWSVEGNVGVIEGGTFKATTVGSGKIIGEYQGVRKEFSVTVLEIPKLPILLDNFDTISNWSKDTAKADALITTSTTSEPTRQGAGSLKLSYDFTTQDTGTKAAYVVSKTPIPISGKPLNLGVWVYGDGGKHWLRGTIRDVAGTKHTIDFTAEGGLNWTGWKYVTAAIPENVVLPIKFEQIYIAQPNSSLQNKGNIYFDQLQAVYVENYEEPIYLDVAQSHWAYSSIKNLNIQGLIAGYPNGTFKADHSITRAEAAVIIAKALNLTASKAPTFTDVSNTHFAYKQITAVQEAGIITGRAPGKFSPNENLTRAEMATILTKAYKLTGTSEVTFKDVTNKHWGYPFIQTLIANNLTSGYDDNTFRPNGNITRAEFAAFVDRVNEK
ncbi:S-layer homology domain-containing protein [Ureibacillus manganicus]|uniref:SLH domain-containing protein n=1 Tax=Ureibacillus manganicus DSM 26584 TaxID=1384049 RepID=A0A0A3I5X1_9BACL|nr:S-layer homology domain-containing protein [Ureibacillus manganicus]KGR80129.1 hypothetical protein CD29_01860 [Ureibacillus manganicus DSM 26584]